MEKENRIKGRKADIFLWVLILTITSAGLMILFSASEYNGRVRFGDSASYFKKQIFASLLGMLVMYFVSLTDYKRWIKYAPYLYVCSLSLLLAVLFIGKEINGSKRWLSIGPLSFQPSEFSKIAVILMIVWRMEKVRKKIKNIRFILEVVAIILPVAGLVASNNLSTAVIILGIGIFLIFVTTPGYRQFITIGVIGIGIAIIFLAAESYRLERIKIWRNPEKYEKGFQTVQGLYAIGSGGIFGYGWGKGIQKLGFVPEAQNDMIFSIICEEFGFSGALLLLILFLLLLWRLCIIALNCRELGGAMLALGIMGHLAIQVILNVAVVTNTIPNTGITLPFISYGGTSILFLMTEMGIALSISSNNL